MYLSLEETRAQLLDESNCLMMIKKTEIGSFRFHFVACETMITSIW